MAEATEKTVDANDDMLARWRASPGVSLTVGGDNAANLVAFEKANISLFVPIASLASAFFTKNVNHDGVQCEELKLTFSNFVVTIWGHRLMDIVEGLDKRSLLRAREALPNSFQFEKEAAVIRKMLWVEVTANREGGAEKLNSSGTSRLIQSDTAAGEVSPQSPPGS